MGNEAPLIRWMIRGDLEQVCNIEDASYEFPWKEEDFLEMLKQRPVIGLVATRGDSIVGYIVYELSKGTLYIHNLAVAAKYRRRGYATHIISKMKDKLKPERPIAEIHVRESCLDAHLFLKSVGFQAVEVCKGWYSDQVRNNPVKVEDAYRFTHRYCPTPAPVSEVTA